MIDLCLNAGARVYTESQVSSLAAAVFHFKNQLQARLASSPFQYTTLKKTGNKAWEHGLY